MRFAPTRHLRCMSYPARALSGAHGHAQPCYRRHGRSQARRNRQKRMSAAQLPGSCPKIPGASPALWHVQVWRCRQRRRVGSHASVSGVPGSRTRRQYRRAQRASRRWDLRGVRDGSRCRTSLTRDGGRGLQRPGHRRASANIRQPIQARSIVHAGTTFLAHMRRCAAEDACMSLLHREWLRTCFPGEVAHTTCPHLSHSVIRKQASMQLCTP